MANTNVGGENYNRGSALGALLGAAVGRSGIPTHLVEGLVHAAIKAEIYQLVALWTAPMAGKLLLLSADCAAATMYGAIHRRCSAPMKVGKVRAALSPELLSYLALDTLVLEETGPGFTRCVDYPDVPGHVYYEEYFHGMRDPSRVWSVNPRTGANFHKPAAGVRLRAFLELVRRKHSAQIEAALEGLPVARRNRSAEIVLRLIRCGYWL